MYSRDSDTYKSTSSYSVRQTDSSKLSERDDPENSAYADSSPSNNEYESQRAVGGDILNADSQSPIKREDIDVDITGDEPSEDQPSPLKFDDQFGEVVDEERDKIQRLNMRHPHSSTAVRDYLNKTVVPNLLSGMKKMVRERPQNPCEFLGRYLIEHCEHDHNLKEENNNTELRIKQEDTDYSPRGRQKRRRGSGSSIDNVGDMDVDNDV
ncbi:8066_t:CDS:2 [Funneliformis caledonium]|uniref:8066_t:CDS:1 n=1 Tax=Funneliformis caledonium TaxID=1117310 RepID=A0A9N8VBK2_9GLOM|nr:8066_t:CDS:2 [Funneliformis caledonium]